MGIIEVASSQTDRHPCQCDLTLFRIGSRVVIRIGIRAGTRAGAGTGGRHGAAVSLILGRGIEGGSRCGSENDGARKN